MNAGSIAGVVNVAGLLTALALYSLLLAMAVRGRKHASASAPQNARPALATAVLGLLWNVGALALLGGSHPPVASRWEEGLHAIAYAALGFLPAVFVDGVARSWRGSRPALAAVIRSAAYGLATLAAVLHALEAANGREAPSELGLRLLAFGFGTLVVAALALSPRQERFRRVVVSAAAVLIFALCALHLAHHLPDRETWPSTVLGHHASLPLILVILYQDYRFAFVDLFLKRAVALVLLASLVLGLYVGVANPLLSVSDGHWGSGPAGVGVLLALWVGTALGFPVLQRMTGRFVDAIVLRRPDYAQLRAGLGEAIVALDSPEQVLEAACDRVAEALHAREVTWSLEPAAAEIPASATSIAIPTHEPPRFVLSVRGLAPGKRLLSDDFALLDAVALLVARRLDSLRLTHERCDRDFREQEARQLATEAELRALRAQLNPHFLFNALNTIGYLMRAAPERAFGTLLDLTRLLRAVLKRGGGEFVRLDQELDLVRAYLAIEGARFEDRLRASIDVPDSLRSWPVPPLLVQPLVENAIRHGITRRAEGGEVAVVIRQDADDQALLLLVTDSGIGVSEAALAAGRREGLGLSSIAKRLAACYGPDASLEIVSDVGIGTRVLLRIPAVASDRVAGGPTGATVAAERRA
jgi:hypothetical protein